MIRIARGTVAALLVVVVIAAGLPVPVISAEKPVVYAVNYPLYYFASRIAGDAAEVVFPVPKDVDPAFWIPEAEEIAAFQKADLILLNGAGYAKWVPKATLSESRMVNTSESFIDRYIKTRGGVKHGHGSAGEHSHVDVAPTTWLDPTLAVIQANAVYEALLKRMPGGEKELSKRFNLLKKDLIWLDSELEMVVAGKQGMPVLTSHIVYQYLAGRYSLNFGSLHWEPDEYPTEEQWGRLAAALEKYDYKATWMIWEREPLAKSVKTLESKNIGSAVFDPCGNRPEKGDYLSVMKANLESLKKVYE